MEQLFAAYPNHFADNFDKGKSASNFIDKYLESRMKMRVGTSSGSVHHNSLSLQKDQKNIRNLSQGSVEKKSKENCKNIINGLETVKAAKLPKMANVGLDSPSEEVHGYFSKEIPKTSDLDEAMRLDNTKNYSEYMEDEKLLSDYKYDYPVVVENKADRDISEKVARIVKLVQPDEKSWVKAGVKPAAHLEFGSLDHENRFSYLALFMMILTVIVGSFLLSTNRLLSSVKSFFDMMLSAGWNWTRRTMAPDRVDTDASLFWVILCTPLFGLGIALYAGFRIVYFFNMVLLSRVPDFIAKKINLKSIEDLRR